MEVLILSSKKRNEFITIDGLNVSNWESENVYRDLRKGNVNVINATVATWENYSQTLANISTWYSRFNNRPEISLIKNVNDILKSADNNKTGIIMGFQNASPIENNAPFTNTGKNTVVPFVKFGSSIFPPFSLGGIVLNISSVAGATPITPGNGFNSN